MPINFLPNDPLSQAFSPLRIVDPSPDRPGNRAGFTYTNRAPEALHPVGSPEFLFWQCREAALRSIEAWETLDGPLTRWQGNRRNLRLRQDAGDDLNAFYDRTSLQFFHHETGSKTTYSGASTDVVAHEAGHAFLDRIRPQLFAVSSTETGAFHEAFGDIMAILVALLDEETRTTLLGETADLRQANFVEATAEDLSDGVRREFGPTHPAAKPRRSLNQFQWVLPELLPFSAPPDNLSAEIHSFGRVVSGCIYDTLTNIFNARPMQTPAALLEATQTTGRLLIDAARTAPLTTRYFRSIGQAMILADTAQNGGTNHLSIRNAFAAHNIALGSSMLTAPTSVLAGAIPAASGKGMKVAKALESDLSKRMGLPRGAKLNYNSVQIGGESLMEAVHDHAVSLDSLDKSLKGVVAMGPMSVTVGAVENRAAILGVLPDSSGVDEDVKCFVQTLLEHDCIKTDDRQSVVSEATHRMRTHEIRKSGSKKVLTRIAFDCFPGCGGSTAQ